MCTFQSAGGEGDSAQLGLPNLGGVFIVLYAGMIASCFIAIFEFMWKKRRMLQDEEVSHMSKNSLWPVC